MENIAENIIDRMNALMDTSTIFIDPNPDNLSEETLAKVNELRAKRNELNNQASALQKEIDELIMSENHFTELKDKYLKVTYDADSYDDIIYCGPVMDITRLFKSSCRVTVGKCLTLYNDGNDVDLRIEGELELSNKESNKFGKRKTNYEEISKEEFYDELDRAILNFKQH